MLQRIDLIQASIRIGLLAAFSFLLLSQATGLGPGIWDNEKLLAFDHVRLLQNGAGITNLNLARIPSLAPDYILAWLTQIFGRDIRQQYALYLILQSSAQLGLSACILTEITRLRWISSLSIITIISFTLGVFSPAWFANLALAALPLNHGGNLVLVLAIIYLSLRLINSSTDNQLYPILGGTIVLASLSNRIAVIQVIIPALILLGAPRLARLNTKGKPKLARIIVISTAIGLALSKLAIKTGCVPPLGWNTKDLIEHARNLASANKGHLGIGYLMLFSFASCIALWLTSHNKAEKSYGFISTSSTALTLAVYPSILLNQGLGDSNLRYLLPVLAFIPITAGTLGVKAVEKIQGKRLANSTGAILTCLIAALAYSYPNTQPTFQDSVLHWENPYSQFLMKHLEPGSAVLSNYESGANTLLSSRSLKAGTNWKIHVSQIANGDAKPWDQGKSEFYENQLLKQLRNYNALIIRPRDHDQALEWYGSPEKVIQDPKLDIELWVYDKKGLQSINTRIKQGLLGPFRVECL